MNRFETFSGSILELNRYLQKIKDLEMKRLGLRGNHTMCLYYLGKNPEGLTVTELVQICKEDKAAVSRCLSELTRQGLVQSACPQGKRSYRTKLRLTDSGEELVQRIYARVEAAVAGGSSGMTDQQREAFYAAMEIIVDNLSHYLAQQEE